MHVGRSVGAERIEMSEELDGLQFAAEPEFEHVADSKFVAGGQRESLQGGIVQAGIGSGEASKRNSHGGLRSILQAAGICGTENGGGHSVSVADVAAEGEMAVGEHRALELES